MIDALIAATARVHGLTVVDRNVKDFELAGVRSSIPSLNKPELVRPLSGWKIKSCSSPLSARLAHNRHSARRIAVLQRAMRGDEQVKLPPLPRDGFAPSRHALPDLRPHRRAPARQGQRSPDRALPAGTPGSARPPFRIAGPRRSPHLVRGLPGGYLPGGAVQCQGGGRGPR